MGSDPTTLGGLLASFGKSKKLNGAHHGIITDGYLPSLGSTSNTWISCSRRSTTSTSRSCPSTATWTTAWQPAYTFVQAMFKAGRNPTRQDLLNAINGGLPQGPSVAPYAYSASDHNGVTGAYIAIIKNGVLVQKGQVLVTDTSPSGAITPFTDSPAAGAAERDSAPCRRRAAPAGCPPARAQALAACPAAAAEGPGGRSLPFRFMQPQGYPRECREPAARPRRGAAARRAAAERRRAPVRRAQLPADDRRRHLRPGGHRHRQLLRPLRLQGRYLRRGDPADQLRSSGRPRPRRSRSADDNQRARERASSGPTST